MYESYRVAVSSRKCDGGSELCMHAHVDFLARGEIHVEYADGCVVEHRALLGPR